MATNQPPHDPDAAELAERQRDQELAEREQLADADTDAEAQRHLRRADKARYLRQKLEQRKQADGEAAQDDD
jgi:hypothetical protein